MSDILGAVLRLHRSSFVVAIMGARQVGRTTLAVETIKQPIPPRERFALHLEVAIAAWAGDECVLAPYLSEPIQCWQTGRRGDRVDTQGDASRDEPNR